MYYVAAACSTVGLLMGYKFARFTWHMHDFVIGHVLFVILFLLSALQFPSTVQVFKDFHGFWWISLSASGCPSEVIFVRVALVLRFVLKIYISIACVFSFLAFIQFGPRFVSCCLPLAISRRGSKTQTLSL